MSNVKEKVRKKVIQGMTAVVVASGIFIGVGEIGNSGTNEKGIPNELIGVNGAIGSIEANAKTSTYKAKYRYRTTYKKKYPKLYASLNSGILKGKKTITVSKKEISPTSKNYYKVIENILYDIDYNNPTKLVDRHHFPSVTNYWATYYDNKSTYEFHVNYRFTPSQKKKYVNNTNTKVASVAKKIAKPSDSDYKKVKAVHDYLKKNISYDYSALKKDYTEAHLAYGGLVKKKGVCDTYAKSAERLLNYMGVDAGYMQGYGNGEDHAWNWVKIDGKYYYMDITWDDTAKTTKYFLINTKQLSKDHKWVKKDYPVATSTKYMKK